MDESRAGSRATAQEKENQQNRNGHAQKPKQDPADLTALAPSLFEFVRFFHGSSHLATAMPSRRGEKADARNPSAERERSRMALFQVLARHPARPLRLARHGCILLASSPNP